jgi:hypothetical protein
MWTTVGCLVVILLASTNAFDRSQAKDKITDFRVRSQNLHVDFIEKELDKLDHEFDELSHEPDAAQLKNVKARVHNLEGEHCPEKHVSCRGDWPECVHHLLVCDGIKDCHNGLDEDEKVCDGKVVHIGSSFRGIVHWHRCVLGHDHYSTITITQTKRSPFFTNRTFLKATVTREYDDGQTLAYDARGYFVYAARKLVLLSDVGSHQHLAVICNFNQGDNDHAECKIVQESSLDECGLVRVSRV